ncbi:hypothetical protein JF634_05075 [Simonsiella muelleri]|uniref:Uncharacterized protein n=1 Tax=Simonsiella muelleri ATCC 29453 TaxID=641147 RepID=U6Q208_9NEIS|nr:hypothetical protein [Simonsiella muelleri]EJZ50115.1 hypothetical protein HMPREF9021_02636 [Simonsiella muelleri ATCC 29453]UBQ55179.1 hypothetical protein JF634_05075 [Simonsiella muelleri]
MRKLQNTLYISTQGSCPHKEQETIAQLLVKQKHSGSLKVFSGCFYGVNYFMAEWVWVFTACVV